MSVDEKADLQCRILAALRRQDGGGSWASWVRFVAKNEAQSLGGTAADAEEALQRLHAQGLLALAFGYERGSLTRRGLTIAERLAGRTAGAVAARA